MWAAQVWSRPLCSDRCDGGRCADCRGRLRSDTPHRTA
ncbi:hypothetical protein XCR_2005 [Xanthomonas campestris pv. raphani 756C]|nr:hypothetical protein XCR_2005 [Xanthomonas campestris pv. raphani 756C]